MSRLLGLDVGERRIGIAVSDSTGQFASPVAVLQRKSKADDFRQIAQSAKGLGVEGLIVGHPLNDDGSAGPQARRIERYAAALEEALRREGLALPLVLWDESHSTQRAQEVMIAAGRSAGSRRERVDAVAAAVILQDYLDSNRPGWPGSVEEAVS